MKTPTFLMPFQQALQDSIKYENSYLQIPYEALRQLKEIPNSTAYIDVIISAWTRMSVEEWEYFVGLLIMEVNECLPYPNIS